MSQRGTGALKIALTVFVEQLEVRSKRDSLTLARDGNSFEGSGSFTVRKRRRELVVYAPAREG